MKQTICNIVHDTIKNDGFTLDSYIKYKDLGYKNLEDLLQQIKSDIQIAIWALSELPNYSNWEHNFIVDTMDDGYETPVYQVGDYTFMIEYSHDGDDKIIPLKLTPKIITKMVWEVDNSIKI